MSDKESQSTSDQIASLNDHIAELQARFASILGGGDPDVKNYGIMEGSTDFGCNFDRQRTVTVRAPTNIAFVKYWGKKNVNLNTPINNSLSATLDPNVMYSETTVKTNSEFLTDTMSINGSEYETVKNSRVVTVLKELRFLARRHFSRIANEIKKENPDADTSGLPPLSFFSQKLQITTSNNFPTAAGLASSASGYAALTFGVARLFGISHDKKLYPQLTEIARQGSGSACRSMYGGFVEWHAGEESDGSDSIATQLETNDHWPDLRFVVCVVKSGQKKVPSTQGMIRSQKTSGFLEFRSETFVDKVLTHIRPAISKRNFPVLSELIMRDSNQLHAVCLDTFPPLEYLNDTSRRIMDMVHRYNGQTGEKCLAYTFDAGPNAVLVTTNEHLNKLCALLVKHFCKRDEDTDEIDDEDFFHENSLHQNHKETVIELKGFDDSKPGGIEFCIVTQIGKGPQVVEEGTWSS